MPGACSQLESLSHAWQDIHWQGFGKDGQLTILCAGSSLRKSNLRAWCYRSPAPFGVTVHMQLSPILPKVGSEQLGGEVMRCGRAGRERKGG